MSGFSKKGEKRTRGEEKMRRKWEKGEMRNKKKEKKSKKERKERKEKKERKESVERKGRKRRRKGKRKISRVLGGQRSKVRGLKLVHAVGSTCGHQKVGVSSNSKR